MMLFPAMLVIESFSVNVAYNQTLHRDAAHVINVKNELLKTPLNAFFLVPDTLQHMETQKNFKLSNSSQRKHF